jgi:biotin synthase
MCYAIPGKVVEISGKSVTVDYFGERKKAINEIHDLKSGEYIYAQGGYVIQKVPEREAVEILETWKELFFELREKDLRLSKLDPVQSGVGKKFTLILDKANEGKKLSREELLILLKTENPAEMYLLYRSANFLRQKYLKNSCCVHGIIEFSNYCRNDCSYCGIRQSNSSLPRYRMNEEEVLSAAGEAIEKHGFKALVLQSGEDPEFYAERIAEMVREIKKKYAVLIFVSVGEVEREGLQKLYAAGARGVLTRFETSNPELYKKLHCGDDLQDRVAEIKAASRIGFLIATGGLIGLEGQTEEDLLNDIMLAKELKAEMYTFGPVLPEGTETSTILKVLAVARMVDPENAKIVVTTGFETLDKNARRLGLLAGASSVMLNVTPPKYRKLYSIYPNRAHETETIEEQIAQTLELLYSLGRAPTDLGVGGTPKL